MNIAEGLTGALSRAGIPVTGVSIGHVADRATWEITYDRAATSEQRAAGEALRASYTVEGDTVGLEAYALGLLDGAAYAVIVAYFAAIQQKTVDAVRGELAAIIRGRA